MFPATVHDPSAAGAGAGAFPDADAYGNGDSDDLDFATGANPNLAAAAAPGPAAAGGGERRPMFQRLWTDEDEIVILRAFAEFTAQRGTAFASHQHDTTPFYEDVRRRLHTDFTKSQLVEKLRRLKRKYRNCVDRLRVAGADFTFRSPHEQAIFEIARTIWRPSSDKHGRDSDDEGNANDDLPAMAIAAAANGATEPASSTRPRRGRRRRTGDFPADAAEALAPAPPPLTVEYAHPSFPQASTLDGSVSLDPAGLAAAAAVAATAGAGSGTGAADSPILSPLFKEMVRAMLSIGGSAAPLGLEPPAAIPGVTMDGERWRQQRILELEVYLRRIDLLQDQARAALEELRSGGGMNT